MLNASKKTGTTSRREVYPISAAHSRGPPFQTVHCLIISK
jgi:hypothetical protein